MSMTIYYLSATGNSLQMAKMLAEQLGNTEEVRLVSIPDALEKNELTELVSSAGGKLDAAFYIDMVSVYLPLSDLPPQAKTQRKLQAAEKRLKEIATQIAERKAVKPHEYFAWPSRLMHRLVQKHPEKLDEDFFTTAACTSCGLCAQICPRKNIQLTDGQPTWHRQCTQCLACLHICPTKSIELGQKTKGRRRYHHPKINVKELFPAKNK